LVGTYLKKKQRNTEAT